MATKPGEGAMSEAAGTCHPTKSFEQGKDKRTSHNDAQVIPAACDAVPIIISSDVETAKIGDLVIHNEDLPMIPVGQTLQLDWIEPAAVPTVAPYGFEVVSRKF